MTPTPPGWYPDQRGEQRYWDGENWTPHVAAQPYGQVQPYGQAQQVSPVPRQACAPGYGVPRTGYAVQSNSAATAGFVLGLLSFIFLPVVVIPILGWLIYLALSVTGLILSIVGLSRASALGSGTGLAVAGLILSIL